MALRLLAMALVALLASGCFVLDEIDKGNAIMDAHSPTRNEKAKEASAKAGKAPGSEKQEGEPKKSWWEGARSLSSADQAPSDDPPVRCRIEGKELFTRQSDCLSQGGKLL